MKIGAIICDSCGDLVFSRARHDLRHCSCGKVYIDGGLDYTRVGFSDKQPRNVWIELDTTPVILYQDWAAIKDKYGIIKGYSNGLKGKGNKQENVVLRASDNTSVRPKDRRAVGHKRSQRRAGV